MADQTTPNTPAQKRAATRATNNMRREYIRANTPEDISILFFDCLDYIKISHMATAADCYDSYCRNVMKSRTIDDGLKRPLIMESYRLLKRAFKTPIYKRYRGDMENMDLSPPQLQNADDVVFLLEVVPRKILGKNDSAWLEGEYEEWVNH